ncbi:MAG: hypothetical protein HOM34_08760 [Planctomycetes bacterium]|mgnify:FL=1|jgi:hypothetical protein|nr:hypothetical protein [Planctomycetota bacterium]MBT5100977.1 hypothetical protein [Planctomycetota bacterium]MBT5120797.1 hypothetical protein [Planctomycetota bacterium]MBT7012303.1 hypothetical protein [Planctomycetota bacterium]
MIVSHRLLKRLAALVWFFGAGHLLFKSQGLFAEAELLNASQLTTKLALATGLILGFIKARFLFAKLCKKNLQRIDGITKPKWWQFYRARFFLLLALMMLTGASLSRMAHGHYGQLLAVATLDLSLGIALLASGLIVFPRER